MWKERFETLENQAKSVKFSHHPIKKFHSKNKLTYETLFHKFQKFVDEFEPNVSVKILLFWIGDLDWWVTKFLKTHPHGSFFKQPLYRNCFLKKLKNVQIRAKQHHRTNFVGHKKIKFTWSLLIRSPTSRRFLPGLILCSRRELRRISIWGSMSAKVTWRKKWSRVKSVQTVWHNNFPKENNGD